jgi:predicted aconitase with swiveling domain
VTVAAGIDIGNSTTEVVIGRVEADEAHVLATGRAPTRRGKGSLESLVGAVALIRRLERAHDLQVAEAVVAPLRPVATGVAELPQEWVDTGALRLAKAGVGTAGGSGVGVGRLVWFGTDLSGHDRVVVMVPSGTGFAAAAAGLAPLVTTGRLAAVLLEDDEAVLVANRLGAEVPVVDEVDAAQMRSAQRAAVEVSSSGRPLHVLPDPLKLVTALGFPAAEVAAAARLAPHLLDVTNAVVAVGGAPAEAAGSTGAWIEVTGAGRLDFLRGHDLICTAGVGQATAYALPGQAPQAVDDLWTVDLAAVAAAVQARRGSTQSRPVSLASLRSDAPYVDPSGELEDLLEVPVHVVPAEAAAARAGGLSTPGAEADSVVVDLGGGTIDAVSARSAVVAAGGGELLTASVAALAGTTRAAAEWVKRGPAHRVEAPQILLAEDGSRTFRDRPAAAETVGSLVVQGPAGLLPFHRVIAPAEWRALRLRLKVEAVGGNVARALRTLNEAPRMVVVVGGPAGDDEVLAAVGGALPAGTAIGRGVVAGALEHRYAVAYGLLVLATDARKASTSV